MPAANMKASPAVGTRSRKLRSVELVVRNRESFLQQYDASFAHGGVFCPTRRQAATDAPAVVRVKVGRRRPAVVLRGRVAWTRPGKHLVQIRAGIAVEFQASERAKVDYLLESARGGVSPKTRRRHDRLPLSVPVCWRVPGVRSESHGTLRDVGQGGAFVVTRKPADHGREVILEVLPPGAEVAMSFAARVAWIGSLDGEPGFGVEWRARDTGGDHRIRELVRRLAVSD